MGASNNGRKLCDSQDAEPKMTHCKQSRLKVKVQIWLHVTALLMTSKHFTTAKLAADWRELLALLRLSV